MINQTDNIIVIKENKLKDELIKSFKEVQVIFKKIYNIKDNKQLKQSIPETAFIKVVNDFNFNDLNTEFIFEAINFTHDAKYENIFVKYGLVEKNILLHKSNLKNATKLILLSLWKKKIIMLPVKFNMGGFFKGQEYLNNYNNPIIEYLENNLKNLNSSQEYFTNNYIRNISKVIRATNFHNVNDIDLDDINKLHIFILKSKKGLVEEKVPLINYYIEHLLSDIKKSKENKYNEIDYKKWFSGFFNRHKELTYLEFLEEKENLKEYRRNYVNEQTKNRNLKQKKNLEKEFDISLIKEDDFSLEAEFVKICKQKKYTWNNGNIPIYEGYNFNQNNDYELWIKLYEKYIEHRRNSGYETEKIIVSTFNFLMNYIFFYLNLYNLQNKDKVEIPKSPKEFHRVLYINKSLNQDSEHFTIKEILEKYYESNKAKNGKIRNIKMFFDFIIDFYEEESDIWTEGTKNPIRKSDFYIERRGNKKTNKEIVPKNIYSKLKKYLFSIETFGEYLFDKSLNEDIYLSVNSNEMLNTESFGFVPVFFENGKAFPIFEIPNLFLFRERTFLSNNKEITKKIPCNTVIRATILMLNTGLRAAQVSWLDRENWNLNKEKGLSAYYKININTDKTKEHDWTSFVSHSVYESLIKETKFQQSLREEITNLTVNYQNREHTRFNDILPLFRGYSNKGLPVDFRMHWINILWSFQNNINRIEDKNYKLINIEKPENNKIDLIGTEKLRYSPLSIKAIYTPHSMRATFCTHMAEYLERSEIAALVGHESDLITSEVYIKPEESTIIDKMNKASDIFENGVNSDYFDKESKAHIKPNKEGSSLQKAFNQNREQTIELFNITSISMNINKDSEEQSKKAIYLLKNARMDHVIFETTHICPVGGICPQEVMSVISEKRRCGLCPLALKCVDNLNPIYAKQRDLMREIKEGKESLEKAIKNKESEISINNIEDKVNLDIRELVSWKFSADILSQHYEDIKDNENLDKKYYVEMPDMVKQHLQKVSVSNEKEYLLTRIADANAYSGLNNNDNKYQAEMIRRNVVKNLNLIELEDYYVSEDEKVEVFCAMIKNMLDTNGIDLKELVDYDCFKSIEEKREQKKLLFKDIKLLK